MVDITFKTFTAAKSDCSGNDKNFSNFNGRSCKKRNGSERQRS